MGNAASDFAAVGNWFEDTFDPSKNGVGDAFNDLGTFFTETIPGAFEDAFIAISEPVSDFFINDFTPFFEYKIPSFVQSEIWEPIKDAANVVYEEVIEPRVEIWKDVGNWFQNDFVDFWESDLPGAFESGFHTLADPVSDFFSDDGDFINFWKNDVGAPLDKYFTETIPEFWSENLINPVGNFFSSTIPDTVTDVIWPYWRDNLINPVGDWFSGPFADFFSKGLPSYFEDIWSYIKEFGWLILGGLILFEFGPTILQRI